MLFFVFFDTINNRGGGRLESHANRKDFFYIVVLILTFITVVVGMTFAIYAWIFRHEEGSSAVYTGTLSVEYLSGNIINVNLLWPISKPSFDTTAKVYRNDFKITNTGNLTGIMDLHIDVELNDFSLDTLKYVLYTSSGDELSSGFLNGEEDTIIASNIVLEGGKKENYILIIWLQENNENQNTEMRKDFMGSIYVDATQQKD